MYSKALEAYVEENRPAEVKLTLAQVRELASRAGLEVREAGDYKDLANVGKGETGLIAWGELTSIRRRIRKGWGPFAEWVEAEGFWRAFDCIIVGPVGVTVQWHPTVEGAEVTFWPHLSYKSAHSFCSGPKRPDKALLEAAGIEPIRVELPETTVTLPRAPWDTSYAWDWGSGMVEDTITCYHSEAPALVIPFIRQLAELAGISVKVGE